MPSSKSQADARAQDEVVLALLVLEPGRDRERERAPGMKEESRACHQTLLQRRGELEQHAQTHHGGQVALVLHAERARRRSLPCRSRRRTHRRRLALSSSPSRRIRAGSSFAGSNARASWTRSGSRWAVGAPSRGGFGVAAQAASSEAARTGPSLPLDRSTSMVVPPVSRVSGPRTALSTRRRSAAASSTRAFAARRDGARRGSPRGAPPGPGSPTGRVPWLAWTSNRASTWASQASRFSASTSSSSSLSCSIRSAT